MEPAPFDFKLRRGRAYNLDVEFGFDTTGMQILAQIRRDKDIDSELLAEFEVRRIDDGVGAIRFRLSMAQVDAIPVPNGYGDIVISDADGEPETWIEGPMSLSGSVTAWPG